MRRRRRIDVWLSEGAAHVEAFFRDSHFGPEEDPESPAGSLDATERVIHEYTVRATVDPATRTFIDCRAEFGAQPWPECPGALASASRLAGTPVAGLRKRVRADFTGVGTCTHLNDTLRALEDVGALLAALERTSAERLNAALRENPADAGFADDLGEAHADLRSTFSDEARGWPAE